MLNRSTILQTMAVVAFVAMASLTFSQDGLFGGNLVSLVIPDDVVAMNQ